MGNYFFLNQKHFYILFKLKIFLDATLEKDG